MAKLSRISRLWDLELIFKILDLRLRVGTNIKNLGLGSFLKILDLGLRFGTDIKNLGLGIPIWDCF